MTLSIIKIIGFLYPFLRELIIGKYSSDIRFRNLKIFFIVISISSIIANYYLLKSVYTLSKTKLENIKTIEELNKKINTIPTDTITITKNIEENKNETVVSVVENRPIKPKIPITPKDDNKNTYRKEDELIQDDSLNKKLKDLNKLV